MLVTPSHWEQTTQWVVARKSFKLRSGQKATVFSDTDEGRRSRVERQARITPTHSGCFVLLVASSGAHNRRCVAALDTILSTATMTEAPYRYPKP